MAIVTVSTSNTFNEWRVVTNQLVTEVNKTESGTATLSADTLTANTITANGDIAVNGGDLTTTSGTFNLANTYATTVNLGGTATTLNLGSSLGTTTIRNDASVSGNTSITGTLGVTGNVTLAGELRGPSTFTIDPAVVGDDTGTVVIKGNLQVDGTTTTINSTTLTVDDLNIVLASGAANAAAANGAGITIDGASATITYLSSGDKFKINKTLELDSTLTVAANTNIDSGTFFVDSVNNRVGVGTTSPEATFMTSGDGPVFERVTSSTTSERVTSTFRAKSTGSSADGFGPYALFQLVDDSATTNDLGGLSIVRSGADNTGKMRLLTAISGAVTSKLEIGPTELVINENSMDLDFRVESDNRTHMFFVDAGTDQIALGQSTVRANATLTVGYWGSSAGNNAQITIDANTNSGTGQAALLLLAGSGSTNRASRLDFLNGVSSTTTPRWTLINDYDQNGTNEFRLVNASTQNLLTFAQSGGVVFNEDSLDYDFRIESDTSTHAFFVDAGNSRIGINQSSPGAALDLVGLGFYQYSPGAQYPIKRSITESNQGSTSTATYSLVARVDFGVSWSGGNFPVITLSRVYRDGVTNYIKYALRSESVLEILENYNSDDVLRIKGPVTYNSNAGVYEIWITQNAYTTYHVLFEGAWSADSIPSTPSGQSVEILTASQVSSTVTTSAPAGLTQASNFYHYIVPNTSYIFNEYGADIDFRIESDTNTHMLFVDAGNNRVGVGTGSPDSALHVYQGNGQIKVENPADGMNATWQITGSDSRFGTQTNIPLDIYTNATRAIRITGGAAGQNVLIGTTSDLAKLTVAGNIFPSADNTYDLGSASYSWANVYTGDLHLSNMKKETGNEIDGTKGDWTIQEGENDLFILNNRTGKKYKFKLEEIQ